MKGGGQYEIFSKSITCDIRQTRVQILSSTIYEVAFGTLFELLSLFPFNENWRETSDHKAWYEN